MTIVETTTDRLYKISSHENHKIFGNNKLSMHYTDRVHVLMIAVEIILYLHENVRTCMRDKAKADYDHFIGNQTYHVAMY